MASVHNFTEQDLQEIAKKWYDKKMEGDYKIAVLFRISTLLSNGMQLIFYSYLQPPLTVCSIIIIAFLTYIFVKEKMLGFVNVLLVLSNFLQAIPALTLVPVHVVFYYFADSTVPMPYPWCYIFLLADESMNHLAHAIALNLKILLALNRICSVYYPFQYSFWFTTKRCSIYLFVVVAVGATTGTLLNFTFEKIKMLEHVDDVWGTGRVQWYNACSIESNFLDKGMDNNTAFITKIIQVLVNIVCIIILFACDIFLIVKIRKRRKQRDALSEGRSAVRKEADKKLDLLNKVSVWVLWVVIISEMPQMVVNIYAIYTLVLWRTSGVDSYDINSISNNLMSSIALLITAVLTPADMIVFAVLSEKIKSRLKKIFCWCRE